MLSCHAVMRDISYRRTPHETKLTLRQLALIGSMLFGLFFGAGNLIFPMILGAKAGAALPAALKGLLVTAVGIPVLSPWASPAARGRFTSLERSLESVLKPLKCRLGASFPAETALIRLEIRQDSWVKSP